VKPETEKKLVTVHVAIHATDKGARQALIAAKEAAERVAGRPAYRAWLSPEEEK
jgi:hypothetical protein